MSRWFYSRSVFVMMGMMLMLSLTGCSGSEEPVEPARTLPPVRDGVAGPKQYSSAPDMEIDETKHYTAVIHTNLGSITAELFPQDAPITVNNFVFLAREGFYNGSPFHRVMKGFMIQAGTPAGMDDTGPGYDFEDEPVFRDYEVGTLAMANRGPDTNGSQFFICDADLSDRLSKNYTIFGKAIEGIDVVHEIASAPVVAQPHGEMSKPDIDIHIESIEIMEGG